jgi:hypothetical protein
MSSFKPTSSAYAAALRVARLELRKLMAKDPSLTRDTSKCLQPSPRSTKTLQGVGKSLASSKASRSSQAGIKKAHLARRAKLLVRQDRAAQAKSAGGQLSLRLFEPQSHQALDRITQWVESQAVVRGGDDSKDELVAR